MLDSTTVFAKVFVREFYRLNAGFFIVVITLTFGFMSGKEHKALAEFFVASPLLSLIPISVWLLYTFKVILFNRQRMVLAENVFLFNTSLLYRRQQLVAACQAVFAQLMPIIVYAVFLFVTALRNNFLQSFLLLFAAVIVLVAISSLMLIQTFKTPVPEFRTSAIKR
ncbi:MAG TPA: hypothetical protein VGD40_03565, partial [Chryseosolibacter sp.]